MKTALMLLYAATIFSSSFLLFLIQPLITKQMLPWFGGSAAVWATAMVFFQAALLAGYGYADWTVRHLRPRVQVTLHLGLLAACLLFLPVFLGRGWMPTGTEDPSLLILGLLIATIGLPYLMLASTGPLIHVWFDRSFPGGSVYRLFALSNLASLLALLSYPFLIEPLVAMKSQVHTWSAGLGVFAILSVGAGLFSLRWAAPELPRLSIGAAATPQMQADEPPPTAGRMLTWVILSALGSWLLLAVTNHITRNVASIPFLWLAPLVLYLLTFILCFERDDWYRRWPVAVALALLLPLAAWGLQASEIEGSIFRAVGLYLVVLLAACLFLHGELATLRPTPRHLTRFYLMVALGGMLGGLFVGLVAPRLFTGYYELGIGLVIVALIAGVRFLPINRPAAVVAVLVGALSGSFFIQQIIDSNKDVIVAKRNFYGTVTVHDEGNTRILINGSIIHGAQLTTAGLTRIPTTYYGKTSGVGLAIEAALTKGPRRVGAIGLGVGTLATYGRPGDTYRFYEIDPQVVEIANRNFTYLKESPARTAVVLGDARLNLEREKGQGFDLLVVDAFSSGSIPVHLITREAMEIYLRHLNLDGIIAFHVSNEFLDLAPVLLEIARGLGLAIAKIVEEEDDSQASMNYQTDYVLISRSPEVLAIPAIRKATTEIEPIPGLGIWTDDFNNLFRILG